MKESDITQPVIDKCKQIAEHWRMETYKGCWLFYVQNQQLTLAQISTPADVKELGFIPIPSISNCLEKLRESDEIEIAFHSKKSGVTIDVGNPLRHSEYGKTLHEALLSALLMVLKK